MVGNFYQARCKVSSALIIWLPVFKCLQKLVSIVISVVACAMLGIRKYHATNGDLPGLVEHNER